MEAGGGRNDQGGGGASGVERRGVPWVGVPWVGALAALMLIVAQVVVRSGDRVLSQNYTDLVQQFMPWRAFGFGEIARGNIPLWTPHNFSGNPFVGNFQSALFYPPNWVHLVLPMGWAINLLFVFHLMVAAVGMMVWARYRGLGQTGAAVAGAVFVLGGGYWLHVYPGHLPFLCTACWTPWVMLAVQKLVDGSDRKRTGWWLAGVVGLQCLGGYPQPVYMTALAAGVFTVALLMQKLLGGERRVGVIAGMTGSAGAAGWVAAAYFLGAGLAAIQLSIGLWTTKESVRAGGTTFEYSSSFSLPPENFALAMVPTLMGDLQTTGYSGRWLMWEVTPYFGAAALLLAVIGLLGKRSGRWTELVLAGVFLLLALGGNTGVHRVLYDWLPMYSSFRVPARFVYIAGMFIGLLAGWGAHRLLAGEVSKRARMALGVVSVVVGVVLAVAGGGLLGEQQTVMGWWGEFRQWVIASRESGQPDGFFRPELHAATGRAAGIACLAFAGVWGASGVAMLVAGMRWGKWVPAAVAMAELVVVAWWFVASAPVVNEYPDVYVMAGKKLQVQGPSAQLRVMHTVPIHRNEAMTRGREFGGMYDVWGYEQVVLLRYAQLMAGIQGFNPALASADVPMVNASPLLAMLRCVYTLEMTADREPRPIVRRLGAEPLPRAFVVGEAEVHETAESRYRRIFGGGWDPRRVALLEQAALPAPAAEVAGTSVEVRDIDTDTVQLTVELKQPGVLVMTDSYSAGWQAEGKMNGQDRAYEVVPVNHCLRGVVLEAGRHEIVMSYSPMAWWVGIWLTLAAGGVWVVWGAWVLWSR